MDLGERLQKDATIFLRQMILYGKITNRIKEFKEGPTLPVQ